MSVPSVSSPLSPPDPPEPLDDPPEPRYGLYGLSAGNPYVTVPLNPLQDHHARELCVKLDSFFKIEPLREYLAAAVRDRHPALVVVSGRDCTGRTTIANHVLDIYRELTGVGNRFVVSCVHIDNSRDIDWIVNAIVQLQNEIADRGLKLGDELTKELREIERIDPQAYKHRYQGLMRRLRVELDGHESGRHAFGLLFEGLQTATLVDAMKTVLRNSRSIAVFTHNDYQHGITPALEQLGSEGVHVVHLKPLPGPWIEYVAVMRWSQVCPREHPFEQNGLAEAWPEPAPIKIAVSYLARLVEYRLLLAKSADEWPENKELRIDRDFVVPTVLHWQRMGVR